MGKREILDLNLRAGRFRIWAWRILAGEKLVWILI
jgi:hypothetical protein